jgi:hypothetical protein
MVCYPILIGEMAKRQIKKKDVAECIGVCYKSFDNKMNGRVAFTWPEVKKIRHEFFPDIQTDELFATTEEMRRIQDSA